MKVCLYCLATVGCYLALRLFRGGATVAVVARGAQLDALTHHGIEIQAPDDSFRESVSASPVAATFGVQDIVIVSANVPSLRRSRPVSSLCLTKGRA